MIESLTTDPAAAIQFVSTILFFATVGAVRTLWAAERKGEGWQKERDGSEPDVPPPEPEPVIDSTPPRLATQIPNRRSKAAACHGIVEAIEETS